MTTAGKARRTELIAVLTALLAAAILAAVLPQSSEGAAEAPDARTAPAQVEVIVRFAPEVADADRRATVRAAGGTITHDLHLIDGVGARMDRAAAESLRTALGVRSVSHAAPVAARGFADEGPAVSPSDVIGATGLRDDQALTGRGVGVAVVDTGIDGHMPDFRVSRTNRRSRVRATAVVNPLAADAADDHGHGTHVAGIIAGDGTNRRLRGHRESRYVGVAPDAHLVSIKIADDDGHATTLDAIYGIQFAVDHADALGIRVVNLSLASTVPESPATDPLAAAAEAAWLQGLVVVAAAGNDGEDPAAVSYAPGNDPYVITVGASDDNGTADTADDTLAPWSSRGVTQQGVAKPDVLAPGVRITSTLARGSRFVELCSECVRDGYYFRASGTSMATAVTSGAAALLLQAHPEWTPDQVKAALTAEAGDLGIVRVDEAIEASPDPDASAQHHPTSTLVDPATGSIDYGAASWRAASWRLTDRRDAERPGWAAASWRCDCGLTEEGELDPQAASWRAASWRVRFRP